MSWSAFPLLANTTHEFRPATAYPLTASIKQLENGNHLRHLHHLSSLGSAWAGTSWQWVGRSVGEANTEGHGPSSESRESVKPMAQSVTVSVPARIKLKMTQVARAHGRSEDDLWAEAANNWLCSHAFDDEPLPPAPAAALAVPNNRRSWEMIDELLGALRQPTLPDRGESQRAA